MAFYSKPSGFYYMSSTEGTYNIWRMWDALRASGYAIEAASGIIGNCYAESGLNPWRWQNDTVNYGAGYGLFQFTPASAYIGPMSWVDGYGPNLSTSSISGGLVTDGNSQLECLINDYLSKWTPYCWRPYWDSADFPYQFAIRTRVLNTYGDGSTLSQAQYKNINNIEDATFAFLACYEGPAYPNLTDRIGNANAAYSILTGQEPPEPPDPPGPGPEPGRKIPIWLLFKIKEANS